MIRYQLPVGVLIAGAMMHLPAAANGQDCPGWRLDASGGGPPTRFNTSAAYDSVRHRLVLCGGQSAQVNMNLWDTWEWDGAVWRERTPMGSSPQLSQHQTVFDSVRGRVVAFGGSGNADGAVWEWDGERWYSTIVPVRPRWESTFGAAFAFDSDRGKCVYVPRSYPVETWEWNGTMWTQYQGPQPDFRYNGTAAFDPDRHMVIYTGDDPSTWGWDGTRWTRLSRTGVRGPLAFDSTRRRMLDANGVTYLNASGVWERFSTLGGVSTGFGYDQSHGRLIGMIIDGGSNAQVWSAYRPMGVGDMPSIQAILGQVVTFTSRVETVRDVTYRWLRDGVAMVDGGRISGTRTPILRISGVEYGDEGGYSVAVDDGCGAVTVGSSLQVACLALGVGPTSRTVSYGDHLELSWEVIGPGPFWFEWRRNGVLLTDGGRIGGATTNTLVIDGATAEDEGTYVLTAINECGLVVSSQTDIDLVCFRVLQQPSSVTVRPGENIQMSLGYSSPYTPTFQWRKNGRNMRNGGRVHGVTTATLTIQTAEVGDAGVYDVTFGDVCSSGVSNPASVQVADACAADFNADGFLDFFDYDDFVGCFESGNCPPGTSADFNGDGFADFFDYDDFVLAFESGC